MKKLWMIVLASVAFAATPAMAEGTAVVNIGKIMQSSKAATSVRSQVQAKQKSFQSELDTKEKALLAEDQGLVKLSKESTDKAAFEKKVKDFRAKAATEQRAIQTKKVQLDKAFASALDEIQKNVTDIVKQIATEKKLNLVVSSSQVLYSDAALDITDDVLSRLDSKLPSVSVKF